MTHVSVYVCLSVCILRFGEQGWGFYKRHRTSGVSVAEESEDMGELQGKRWGTLDLTTWPESLQPLQLRRKHH